MLRNAVLFYLAVFCASAFAEKNATVTIYIGGDYSSVKYHLGVLSEIERLQIPIDTVVCSDWGIFVGHLWSSGWSSRQILELVKSWDSIPRAKEFPVSALWKKSWQVRHVEGKAPFLEPIDEKKPYFGQIFFDLRVQESLWRTDAGSKIPFRSVDSANSYPFPNAGSAGSWRILSTSIALRDTNGAAEQRYQQKLWKEDSSLIILRPHAKPHLDSLFEAGKQAVQTRRSFFAQMTASQNKSSGDLYKELVLPAPRFLYHPVFDSVSSEFQGHLESFWNDSDTGSLAIFNFLENLQRDGFYRDIELFLDTGSFLQIKASSDPHLSLSLYGFGGTLFGANIAGNLNFRFVNQFGYNLSLTGFYGQGASGVEPMLRLERFFMDDGSFFAKAKVYEYKPTSFFQKSIYEYGRILKESGRIISIGVEKAKLQIGVEFERKEILSGASGKPIYDYEWDYELNQERQNVIGVAYEPIATSSMFPYAKWLWSSEGYERWFSTEGFMAELLGGFRAISISSYGYPLYFSSSGKTSITHPLSRYFSVSGGTEFGANFRRAYKGSILLPEELGGHNGSDLALENRFRFAMGLGSYREIWQTPVNSSHRYGILSAGFSAHLEGSGIFLAGGFANDGVGKIYAEPKIRIKTQTFDFVLGQNIIYSGNNRDSLIKRREKHTFLSIQGGIL